MGKSKVQQLITRDEIDAGEIEQLWLDVVSKRIRPEGFPAEITSERTDKETNITTVWSKGYAIAISLRQRDQANFTVLTLVELPRPFTATERPPAQT